MATTWFTPGFAPAWAMVRGDYAQSSSSSHISCALMGLSSNKRSCMLTTILCAHAYLAFLSHYVQYWLPA